MSTSMEVPKLRVLITDPEAEIVQRPDVTWCLSGVGAEDRRHLAERGGGRDELETEIMRRTRDASIVKVRFGDGLPTRISAWRGILSDHQVFWFVDAAGDVGVTDHFRNALALLPVEEREPSEEARVEHFLYRQVLGRQTYCHKVERAGHGDKLEIDLVSGKAELGVFDRIEDASRPEDTQRYVERIDAAMASVLEPLRNQTSIANQFSGGVDSTLIQTYLGSDVPALNLIPDTPEFGRETRYATRAAELLGIPLECHEMKEVDYLEQLEHTIDEMGLPPIHEGTVLDREAYRLPYRRFIVGEHGDTVFGLGGRRARIGWWLRSRAARLALRGVQPLLPGSLRERLAGLDELALGLTRKPWEPEGFPIQRNLYTETGLVEAIFGEEPVHECLVASWVYMMERVELAAPSSDPFLRHLETARWIGAFDDVILPQRHLAQARGKSVTSPFGASPVLASALSVPVGQRYLRGLRDKYLLKRLLKQRLPGYPVHQRKLSTELPFERYYSDGPLSSVWRRYPVPTFIETSLRHRVTYLPNWVTWNALTWAIWDERIARNPELQPVPYTRDLCWDLAVAPRAVRAAGG